MSFPGNSNNSYQKASQTSQASFAAPSGPPPGYSRPSCPPPSHSTQSYQAPSGPPPKRQVNVVDGISYQNPDTPPPMPSQNTQTYQTMNGQTEQFAYSQCNGVKKALLIGINYIGTQNELRGCINDAHNVYNFLLRSGYPAENIVLLSDDQTTNPRGIPTKANMLSAMQWLTSGSQPGDSLFFHYSGHGGQEEDQDADEADGQDDCIYPVDFNQAGSIIDDTLHDYLVKPLPAGCRLTAIFDSCHSGTVLDLPFVYRAADGGLKEYNVWKESAGDAMNVVMGYMAQNTTEMISGVTSMYKRFTAKTSANAEKVKAQKFSPADVLMFSGCKDSQTSADAQENGSFTGALSWAFIKVLTQNNVQSYLTVLQNLRTVLATKYSQKPQMSTSHQIDPNLRFII